MLRDRDAPVTPEGIIMRVYGYDHPPKKYICDVEYAPESIYKSDIPRALRNGGKVKYYKFYEDQGLKFVLANYPQYTMYYPPLKMRLVAISEDQMAEVRRPQEGLKRLMAKSDPLAKAAKELIDIVQQHSKLKNSSFGVFGSLLHDFYRAEFSDLDFIVYGMRELKELREVLADLYSSNVLKNEFDVVSASTIADWRFNKYTIDEYIWHQRRKLIYGILSSKSLKRDVKFEFEPVMDWSEIVNEYQRDFEVKCIGFIEALIRITDDRYAPFMPSKYEIEVLEILSPKIRAEPIRIVSYVEEFRLQLFKDEIGLVAGWLEEVRVNGKVFQQIVLTRRERYYDQVLKLVKA